MSFIVTDDALGRDGGSMPMKETTAGHCDDGAESYDLRKLYYLIYFKYENIYIYFKIYYFCFFITYFAEHCVCLVEQLVND